MLGELCGGAAESRFARDLPEVVAWVKEGAGEPITVQEANFQPDRLLTLRTRNSSAYKGIYVLLMRDGCRDLRTGEPIEAQTLIQASTTASSTRLRLLPGPTDRQGAEPHRSTCRRSRTPPG